jgi:putative MATE family efflux protein
VDNRNQSILDTDRIGRLLLQLSLPAFLGTFVMTLYNVVDTIFIGHYVGPLGIAGLSMVFPVQMLSMGVGMMTGMGGASLISRLIGAGNKSRAEHALGNAVTCTIALSILISIICLVNVDFWLRLIGTSETVLPYARDFMTIILYGLIFQTYAMALNSLIRAEGNTRVPMIGMILGAVLNAAFCALFIIALGMGVKGSALATVIAQLISSAYLMLYYLGGKSFLKMHLRTLALQWGILKEIFAIGAASLAMTITGSLSAALVNKMLVVYGGDLAISAYGILNRVMMFAGMPGMVIGQGLQPILGFNYGAKRYDRALKVINIAIIWSTTFSVLAFVVLFFIPEPLIRIFTSDSELITLSVYASKRIFFAIYLMGFFFVGSLVFQSIGKAVESFVTSIARSALFLIPLVLILPRYLQLEGVWLSIPITDALSFLLTFLIFAPQLRIFRRMSKSMKRANVAGLASGT